MTPIRRKKACWPCRSQKVKCDVEPPDKCSRCKRMNLSCILSSDMNARQTKAQLQHELEQLRGVEGPEQDVNQSILTRSTISPVLSMTDACDVVPIANQPAMPMSSALSFHRKATPHSGLSSSALEPQESSSLMFDGDEIDGRKIQECITLFLQHNQPLIPIIDPNLSADDLFGVSPLLFWTIVFIGSRRYSGDPTLMGRLGPKMNHMALTSLESRTSPLHSIQALVLLCVWPPATNTTYKDMSLVLAGAAIHLAMQYGLHVTGGGQDFARTKLSINQTTDISRAILWEHCSFVCNCTSLREGMPPLTIPGTLGSGVVSQAVLSSYDPDIRTRREIHEVLMSGTEAIARIVIPMHSENTSADGLSALIRLFDTQLVRLSPKAQGLMNSVYLHCCRVQLLAYHFLEQSPYNHEGLVCLHMVACEFIRTTTAQDDKIAGYCPVFIERTILLAAFAILRVQRSSELAPVIDLGAGERAYFDVICLCRRLSVQNDDVCARGVTILSQLWTSKRLFKRADGHVDSLSTRIRSRMSMSIVFDCFWWWREEFAGLSSPYKDKAEAQGHETYPGEGFEPLGSTAPQEITPLPTTGVINNPPIFADDTFPDYDWAANFDFSHFNWAPEGNFDESRDDIIN